MDMIVTFLQGIGILLGVFVIYLLIVALAPCLSVPKQRLNRAKQLPNDVDAIPSLPREDVSFQVKGTSVSAWLYLPGKLSAPVPCIIMGHGFGGIKDMLLEQYAIRYQKAGYVVLTFDYRHFGESEGQPRQLFLIRYQLEDHEEAIKYARSRKEVDPARIALWGTSGGGGYGIVIAAKDKDIACVVSHCAGLDHKASMKMFRRTLGIRHLLRLIVHAQRDLMRSRLGLSPHKIPIVGKPGTMAFFPTSDAYDGYSKVGSESFVNEVCARIILRSHGFNPVKHIRNVSCPVLIQICDHDSLAPIGTETEEELRKYAEVKRYPIGHFDIYIGSHFEKAVGDQLEFFKNHL
ncbi:MAG: alpha/beta fold hydrolase [candidate division Zixibacteria bacterium]|nr:alpha/beta fold hydrolase [candidate division Zixibacteria bacterium]